MPVCSVYSTSYWIFLIHPAFCPKSGLSARYAYFGWFGICGPDFGLELRFCEENRPRWNWADDLNKNDFWDLDFITDFWAFLIFLQVIQKTYFFWQPFNKCYGNQFHCYGSWLAFEICAGWWDGKLTKIPRPCGHLRQDRLMVRSCPINYGWRFEDGKAVGSCTGRNVRNGVCDSCILSKHLGLAYAVHFAFLCSKPVRIGSTFFNLDQFAESNI